MNTVIPSDFSNVSTSTIATVLLEFGYRQQFLVGLRSFGGARRFAGEAFTMRLVPERKDLVDQPGTDLFRETIDTVAPGSVIVVDSMRDPSAASFGGIMAARLVYRGAAAFVTDGAIRDAGELAELPLGVAARAASATTRKAFFHLAGNGEVVSCAGVAVVPGDFVVGDHDGVVIVPRASADEVLAEVASRERYEEFALAEIQRGAPLKGTYPPAQDALDRYAEWESAHRSASPQAS